MTPPLTDSHRLSLLRATGLFDHAGEESFDRLTRLALRVLGAHTATLTLVGEDRESCLSGAGGSGTTPAPRGLSRQVVEEDAPLVVEGVAAVPVRHPDGPVLGLLSAARSEPESRWTQQDVAVLSDLAAMATAEIALRLTTHELDADRTRMRAIVESALDAIVVMESSGAIVEFNPAAELLFGYTRDQAIGRPLRDLLVPHAYRAAHTAAVARNVATGESSILDQRLRLPALRADGTEVPIELTVTRTEVGGAVTFIGFLRDLSAELALDAAEFRMQAVVSAAPMILFAFDRAGIITLSQGTGLATIGLEPDEAVGRSIFDFYADAPDAQVDLQRALRGENFTSVTELGEARLETHYRPILAADGSVSDVVGVTLDVTERRRSEQRIAHMAYHDQLTGLANRAGLEAGLADALGRADASGRAAALLYVDLDDFKTVNDSLGHEAGDQILREAADRLSSVTRQGDLLSRQGGDEFLLFLDDLGADAHEASEAAARRAIEAFEVPFHVNGLEFQLGATIGVGLYPRDGRSFGELLRNADIAMYQAKRSGRGVHAMYTPGATDPRGRLTIGARLRRALANGEFVLYYQPIFTLASGMATGMEALIRWKDPERGLLLPADFIPAAEQTGRIVEIGAWVADAACRQSREWRDLGYEPVVGFNVSPVQLRRKSFVLELAETFARHGVEPSNMVVEITEAVAMEDVPQTSEVLTQLADLGANLVVDDFGAGHSSLTRLRHLPFAALKIDQALMQGVDQDPAAQAVVEATLALAEALELRTVAEGVETDAQRRWLAARGCQFAQGFGLARPMAGPQATELLRRASLSEPHLLTQA